MAHQKCLEALYLKQRDQQAVIAQIAQAKYRSSQDWYAPVNKFSAYACVKILGLACQKQNLAATAAILPTNLPKNKGRAFRWEVNAKLKTGIGG